MLSIHFWIRKGEEYDGLGVLEVVWISSRALMDSR